MDTFKEYLEDDDESQLPCRCDDGVVYTPYITRKGKRIYRRGGGVFAFKCTRCNK